MRSSQNADMTPVAITGMGVVTSIGHDCETLFSATLDGKCGTARFTRDEFPHHAVKGDTPAVAGLIRDFDPADYFSEEERARWDGQTLLLLKAVDEALADCGSIADKRVRIIVGSAVGHRPPYRRMYENLKAYSSGDPSLLPEPQFYPTVIMEYMIDTVIQAIRERYGLVRAEGTPVTAICASGSLCVALGYECIADGEADAAICVGFDYFHPLQNTVFHHFNLIAEGSCIPFDPASAGFQLAEGVGAVLLEAFPADQEGAPPVAYIEGIGLTNDAYHLVIASPAGKEYGVCLQQAMDEAGVGPEEIDLLAMIGRGSKLSDAKELMGAQRVFGAALEGRPISSITGYTGYMLGASGIVTLVAALMQMARGIVIPVAGHTTTVNRIKARFPATPEQADLRRALVCSHGFTGVNVALVVRRGDA